MKKNFYSNLLPCLLMLMAMVSFGFKASAQDVDQPDTPAVSEMPITLVSPVPGSSLPALVAEESKIEVYIKDVPTEADELEVVARIYAPDAEDPIYTAFLWPAIPEEGETQQYNYAQTIYETIDLIKDKEYTINITVTKITYPAMGGRVEEEWAQCGYVIYGTSEPFVYSEAALIGINPNPATTDITSTDQNVITLTFNAAVTVTKAGTPIGFGAGLAEWTVAKTDEEGLTWTIDIPERVISSSKSSINVSFWAVDAEGHPIYLTTVEGINQPTPNKDNTYFNFTYICTVGAPDFIVDPANDSELEVLDKIYVSYPDGINPSWITAEPITLYKGKGANQEVVQTWSSDYFDMWDDAICVEYADENLKWCIMLNEPITEPGYYTFVFPNGFFNLGNEFNQSLSKITDVHYIIPGETPGEQDNVIADPEAGSTVSSLSIIKVTWVDASDAGVDWNVTDPIVLLNAENNVVTEATIDMSMNWDDPWNMLIVTLDQEVKANGEYVLVIPTGKVLLNDGAQSSTEVRLSYTIASSSGIGSVAAEQSANQVYNLQGVKVYSDLNALTPGIYVVNGHKVKVSK